MEQPLYRVIAEDLRRRIASGELGLGDAVPSEATLGTVHGASRGTVRQALGQLRAEGLIGGGRGRPPVVRSQRIPQPFDTLLSFTRWVERSGRTPGQRTIEIARRPATREAADALGLDEGEPVVQLLRLRLLDGVPAMIERTTFVAAVGRLLFDMDPDAGSVYAYLTERGVELVTARHVIDALAADDMDARLLDVGVGAPLLRERRRACGTDGDPLEYSDDRYLPHLVTFTIDNAGPPASTPVTTALVRTAHRHPTAPGGSR